MTVYFKFKKNDSHIVKNLSSQEITKVVKTQLRTDYEFSFHTMHESGWPVYIIESGKRGVRSRPKINLKDKQSHQAVILSGDFDESRVGQEAKDVVVANWAIFQKLAKLYYEGSDEVSTRINFNVLPKAFFTCNNPQCANGFKRVGGRPYTLVFSTKYIKQRHIKFLNVPGGINKESNVEHTPFKCVECGWSLNLQKDLMSSDLAMGHVIYVDRF